MSTRSLPRTHPRTGAPLRPLGYRKNGRAIWPILGGSEPVNQPPPTPPAPPSPPASSPARPEGISEAEWAALGDPGKTALVREREARRSAEQALAAARATPPAPPATPAPPAPPKPTEVPKGPDGQPDIAAIVQQAVAAATAPIVEAQAQREAAEAAQKVRDAVAQAAGERFHDAADAVAQLDLTTLIDNQGRADTAKVDEALTKLLERKPYLGKAVDTRRRAPDGSLIGGGGSNAAASLEDRVKAQLALMNASGL